MSDPGAAFAVLARLPTSDRRATALALVRTVADNDAEAGPYDPLLMMLQAR
jgi:hypothetical protein